MTLKVLAPAVVFAIGFSTWLCPSTPPAIFQCPIECVISAEEICPLGNAPSIDVRIFNRSHHNLPLVGSLDGSSDLMRYPLCRFEIDGPEGWSPDGEYSRCGNTNRIRDADFVMIPPSGCLNPYDRERRFFRSSQLRAANFQVPGEYRIRFRYSTEARDESDWNGHFSIGGGSPELRRKVAGVPKVSIVSNTIRIRVE